MRLRQIALAVGALVLSLSAASAFADDWYHRDHDDDRGRWEQHYERRDRLREQYQRDLAHFYHERREGDWREAEQLRHRLWWERSGLYGER